MRDLTITDSTGKHWARVSKRKARRYYELNKPVILCPVNLQPFGQWGFGLHLNRLEYVNRPFDYYCQQATWFNCTDRQTGLYLSYYVSV